MAGPKPPKPPNLEAIAFIQGVMDALSCEIPRDLAKRMGWTGDDERKLYKWHAGKNAPNFEATYKLVKAAGWLNMDADAPAVGETVDPRDDRLEALRALVERQGQATTRALKGLEAQTREIRDLLAPPGQEATEEGQ